VRRELCTRRTGRGLGAVLPQFEIYRQTPSIAVLLQDQSGDRRSGLAFIRSRREQTVRKAATKLSQNCLIGATIIMHLPMTGVRQQPLESRLLRPEQVPIAFAPVLTPYESPMVVSDGLSTALSVTRLGIQAGVEVSTLLFEVLP